MSRGKYLAREGPGSRLTTYFAWPRWHFGIGRDAWPCEMSKSLGVIVNYMWNVCMCVCVYMCMCESVCMCVWVCMCVCVYVCIYPSVCPCVCVQVRLLVTHHVSLLPQCDHIIVLQSGVISEVRSTRASVARCLNILKEGGARGEMQRKP